MVEQDCSPQDDLLQIQKIIKRLDYEGNGTIRVSDLKTLLKDVLSDWSAADLSDFFSALDSAAGKDSSQELLRYDNLLDWLFEYTTSPASSPFFGQWDKGVSVKHLTQDFIVKVMRAGRDQSAKIHEIEPIVIRPAGSEMLCPKDNKPGAAYIDTLRGEDNVGDASFLLTYTWDYTVGEIADTLSSYCKSKSCSPDRTYVWICCLCVNQHRVQSARSRGDTVPFSEFERTFGDRVKNIGHIVAMMTPWRDPECLKRVWCDYELFMATALGPGVCEVTIAMPTSESNHFMKALVTCEGLDQVWKTFARIDVKQATASVQSDADNIFKLIEAGPGFKKVNGSIVDWLRTWLIYSCERCLFEQLDNATLNSCEPSVQLCRKVGNLFRKLGLPERSLEIYSRGMDLLEESDLDGTLEAAKLLRSIGSAKGVCKDANGQLQAYSEAKIILEEIDALKTEEGATLLDYFGDALRRVGQLSAALDSFSEALEIYSGLGELQTTDVAYLYRNIGKAKMDANDLDGASRAYQDAVEILRGLGKLDTPDGALLLMALGEVQEKQGFHQKAQNFYRQASGVYEKTGASQSLAGTKALHKANTVGLDSVPEFGEA